MSLSLAIALNVLLCLSLLSGLARVMSLANRLTPHVPAEWAAGAPGFTETSKVTIGSEVANV